MSAFKSCVLTFLMVIFVGSNANAMSDATLKYLMGVGAYTNKEYAASADYIYMSLNEGLPAKYWNDAYYYMMVNSVYNKKKEVVLYYAILVKPEELNPEKQENFARITQALGDEFTQAKKQQEDYLNSFTKSYLWVRPYMGKLDYSANSQKEAGSFYGASGAFAKGTWSFSLGGEKDEMDMKGTAADYKQSMLATSVGKTFFARLGTNFRYSYISSDTKSQSGISVYGAGLSFWTSATTKLFADYFYSHYANSSLRNMSANQINLGFDHWWYSSVSSQFWSKLGVQRVSTTFDDQSYLKEDNYDRFYLDLNWSKGKFDMSGSGWLGEEGFGVRSDGALIYSAIEKHKGGFGGSIGYRFFKPLRLQITSTHEKVEYGSENSTARTTFAMLDYNLY